MSDLLDHLAWKPWPNDPIWSYADIPNVARVSRRQDRPFQYWVRGLMENGRLGDWHYQGVDRTKAIQVLREAIPLDLRSSLLSSDSSRERDG